MANAAKTPRKATNLTLDAQAIADAKELGINISAVCDSSNAWVEKHGLPLAKYRMF